LHEAGFERRAGIVVARHSDSVAAAVAAVVAVADSGTSTAT